MLPSSSSSSSNAADKISRQEITTTAGMYLSMIMKYCP